VRMDQPYSRLADTMLDVQYVRGDEKLYDDTGWTLGYARNIDFSRMHPNDTIPFDMFLDRQVYHLYIRYLGKETIRTKYAKFRCIKFRPLLIKGTIFEGGEKMNVWVSDDPNPIALRVESPISVGSVVVDMINYRNLRYPLSSLVDL
ncbi:MAG: DUF3108 domain-containing protein, partial [Bacteroidota bacterium]|nr:DUF3108 domain-containing protein [Bacteroidota bacterium]